MKVEGVGRIDVTPDPSLPIEEMSTDDIVDRARGGDREAYSMLFNRFHDEIYRFAARRLGDPVAGQDAASETFADAFSSIHRFQWRGYRFEAWLYTIARRRIADQLRTRKRVEHAAPQADRAVMADPSSGVLDSMHMRELIARLPDAERDVIELRFMEDLDVEQTALRLDRSQGAVRVAQHRGLQRLRGMLGEGAA
jgi:RNA polymerase sigma-70 factor (ECF subfamily)